MKVGGGIEWCCCRLPKFKGKETMGPSRPVCLRKFSTVQAHADDVTDLVEARAMALALLVSPHRTATAGGGDWRGPRLNLGCRVPDHPKPAPDHFHSLSQQLIQHTEHLSSSATTPTPSLTRQDRIFFGLHRRFLLLPFFSSSLCPAPPPSPRPRRLPPPRSSAIVSPTVTSAPFVPAAKSGRSFSISCRRQV